MEGAGAALGGPVPQKSVVPSSCVPQGRSCMGRATMKLDAMQPLQHTTPMQQPAQLRCTPAATGACGSLAGAPRRAPPPPLLTSATAVVLSFSFCRHLFTTISERPLPRASAADAPSPASWRSCEGGAPGGRRSGRRLGQTGVGRLFCLAPAQPPPFSCHLAAKPSELAQGPTWATRTHAPGCPRRPTTDAAQPSAQHPPGRRAARPASQRCWQRRWQPAGRGGRQVDCGGGRAASGAAARALVAQQITPSAAHPPPFATGNEDTHGFVYAEPADQLVR